MGPRNSIKHSRQAMVTTMISLIPTEYFTHITLPQIVADDTKDGYQFGNILLVFVDWASIGAPNSKTGKVRAYLCIIDSGA